MYDALLRYYTKIIVGNLNAKSREEVHKQIVGRHSLHESSNDNGVRLINFAIGKGVVIGSTRLPRRDIYINIRGPRHVVDSVIKSIIW